MSGDRMPEASSLLDRAFGVFRFKVSLGGGHVIYTGCISYLDATYIYLHSIKQQIYFLIVCTAVPNLLLL